MSEQTGPEGIDQQLDAGVSDEQAVAPGSDAAADADPAEDRQRYGDVVEAQQERSTSAAPAAPDDVTDGELASDPAAQEPPD